MQEHHGSEYRPLRIFGNQAQVALSLRSPDRFSLLVTAALCSGWGRGSEVESNLPNDTQQGSSRAGRSALFFLYRILWLTYQAVPEEGDTVPGVWEGTEPLDSEWSTVLGMGLYQPGVNLTSEPRDQ